MYFLQSNYPYIHYRTHGSQPPMILVHVICTTYTSQVWMVHTGRPQPLFTCIHWFFGATLTLLRAPMTTYRPTYHPFRLVLKGRWFSTNKCQTTRLPTLICSFHPDSNFHTLILLYTVYLHVLRAIPCTHISTHAPRLSFADFTERSIII